MRKNSGKPRRNIWIYYIIIGLCVAMIAISAAMLIRSNAEYQEGDNTYELLEDQFLMAESGGGPSAPPYASPDPNAADGLRYRIDFDKLQAVNADLTAWLIGEGTKISYPVAHGPDNSYYLNYLFDGTRSRFGTLFIDCQNSPDFMDQNTVIYGHRMKNGSMFASLLNYQSQEYYDEHPTMYLFTPERNYRVDIFSAYVAQVTSDAYIFNFPQGEYLPFIDDAIKQSDFISDIRVSEADRIITLSTCTRGNDAERYVVHGKLVPID